ncbi:chitinase [Metarhizium rileyi]|uniref:Chitinase n=1 Tax=Metarhizium rileyi (strain RCEF 4871) TaxID=1649241 RepID=A0A166YA44_METRR|nr:chitinase [Metarhizium rileyi RCEF 4871]
MDPLVKVWDKELAGYYDKQLEYQNLHAFLGKYRDYEPRSVVEWVLYNPTQAGPGIKGADAASQALCRVPELLL